MPDPTAEEFVDEFREFDSVDHDVIRSALRTAGRRTPSAVWADPDERTEALMWLAAHLLTGDPEGAEMRIEGPGNALTSFYLEQRQAMEGNLTVGGDIAGGPSTAPPFPDAC